MTRNIETTSSQNCNSSF